MSHSPEIADQSRRWTRFRKAPLSLQTFILFTALATALLPIRFLLPDSGQMLVPIIGWGSSVYPFMMGLIVAVLSVLGPDRKPALWIRWVLLVGVFFGFVDLLSHTFWMTEDFGNPYLTYSALRPLFTILLPAAWIAVLRWGGVRAWALASP